MGVELIKAEAEKSARSKNPDAVNLTMRSMALFQQNRTQPNKERNNAALALFEQALKIDPNDADGLCHVAVWRTRSVAACQELLGRCDCGAPRAHRRGAKRAVRLGGSEMTLDVEGVVDGGVG